MREKIKKYWEIVIGILGVALIIFWIWAFFTSPSPQVKITPEQRKRIDLMLRDPNYNPINEQDTPSCIGLPGCE